MFFLAFYGLGILSALGRLARGKRRSREEAAEVVLQHLLVLGYGVGGVFAFIGHRFRADEVARSIGWPTGNPFQEEIAWANLGGGVAGLLCLWQREGFWAATAISGSVFYVGAALTHIRELRRSGNTAVSNVGAILPILPDLLAPATVLSLLWVRGRGQRSRG
jgi:hypothetical protein